MFTQLQLLKKNIFFQALLRLGYPTSDVKQWVCSTVTELVGSPTSQTFHEDITRQNASPWSLSTGSSRRLYAMGARAVARPGPNASTVRC